MKTKNKKKIYIKKKKNLVNNNNSKVLFVKKTNKHLFKKYFTILVREAKLGRLYEGIGRNAELDLMMEILLCKQNNNILLIGDSGIGKTTLVELLAHKIAKYDVPFVFFDFEIIKIDLKSILQNTLKISIFFMLKLKLMHILKIISKNSNFILFIENFEKIYELFNYTYEDFLSINLNKKQFQKTELFYKNFFYVSFKCIATCNTIYYPKLSKDITILKRFVPIKLNDLENNQIYKALNYYKYILEEHHNVKYQSTALSTTLKFLLTNSLVIDEKKTNIIDKNITIFDRIGARRVLINSNLNSNLLSENLYPLYLSKLKYFYMIEFWTYNYISLYSKMTLDNHQQFNLNKEIDCSDFIDIENEENETDINELENNNENHNENNNIKLEKNCDNIELTENHNIELNEYEDYNIELNEDKDYNLELNEDEDYNIELNEDEYYNIELNEDKDYNLELNEDENYNIELKENTKNLIILINNTILFYNKILNKQNIFFTNKINVIFLDLTNESYSIIKKDYILNEYNNKCDNIYNLQNLLINNEKNIKENVTYKTSNILKIFNSFIIQNNIKSLSYFTCTEYITDYFFFEKNPFSQNIIVKNIKHKKEIYYSLKFYLSILYLKTKINKNIPYSKLIFRNYNIFKLYTYIYYDIINNYNLENICKQFLISDMFKFHSLMLSTIKFNYSSLKNKITDFFKNVKTTLLDLYKLTHFLKSYTANDFENKNLEENNDNLEENNDNNKLNIEYKYVNNNNKILTSEILNLPNLNENNIITTVQIEEFLNELSGNTQEDIENLNFAELETTLVNNIAGQQNAINRISKTLKRNFFGITKSNRPIGSFLFTGPTGVGKTELCNTLAIFLYGTKDLVARYDMSEFAESHTLSRLVGAPPGYVGYGDDGELITAIKQKPNTIVLFDELEKAHAKVPDMLLQILEDGRLTSGKRELVSFTKAIIIATSNVGGTTVLPLLLEWYEKLKENDTKKTEGKKVLGNFIIFENLLNIINNYNKSTKILKKKFKNMSLQNPEDSEYKKFNFKKSSFNNFTYDLNNFEKKYINIIKNHNTFLQKIKINYINYIKMEEFRIKSHISNNYKIYNLVSIEFNDNFINTITNNAQFLWPNIYLEKNLYQKFVLFNLINNFYINDVNLIFKNFNKFIPYLKNVSLFNKKKLHIINQMLTIGKNEIIYDIPEDIMIVLKTELSKKFRPEFLNRFDNIILFEPLNKEVLSIIYDIHLQKTLTHMLENGINLIVDSHLKDAIINNAYDPEFGARPLRRALENTIDDGVANALMTYNLRAVNLKNMKVTIIIAGTRIENITSTLIKN